MTTPESLPPETVPPGDAAARLFEVGLTGSAGRPRVQAPPPAEIGVHFPEFELIEVLGQGGMGVVYKARQKKLDRLIALKVLPRHLSEDPAFAERFAREARTLARLDHPQIVDVHEFGERDGLFFLAMEYVDGVTLRQLMASGDLTPREAMAIVPQICTALQFAHDQGVVHRDIKPENILLDKQGRVKVADFGLAKLATKGPADFTLTGTDQVMGTLHYMAPEQYKTPQAVDHRADIFSLGVVFYEMLTGELPVGRFQSPSEARGLDVRVDEIVMRALERERDQRYQKVADVNADVTTLARADVEPILTEHPSVVFADETPARRPFSRFVLWSVALIPLAPVLGFLVRSIAHEPLQSRHSGEIPGICAGIGTLVVAGILCFAAALRVSRRRGELRGRLLAIVGCVAVLASLFGALQMLHDAVERRSPRRTPVNMRHPWSPGGAPIPAVGGLLVHGASAESAAKIQADILKTWSTYLQFVRVRDLTLGDVQKLYAPDDFEKLRTTRKSIDVWNRMRNQNALGLGLVGADTAPYPVHRFTIQRIDVDGWEREAKVTARYLERGRYRRMEFQMKRTSRRTSESGFSEWVFASAPVTFSE